MTSYPRKVWRKGRMLPAVFALLLLFVPRVSFAQEGHAESSRESQASGEHHESNARELNRESRESAGEGENAQFKHSASVQWLAKVTGLTVDQMYWISVIVNFGVIAGAILWVAKKNLPGVFRNRTSQIQKAMQEAGKASEDANRRLAEIETRLSHLDTEIAGFRATTEKEAAAEESRMQAAAEEEKKKIVESAEQEIATAAKSARRDLKAYAASLAVSLAEKQIQIAPATDQALVRNFTQELAANGGKGGN